MARSPLPSFRTLHNIYYGEALRGKIMGSRGRRWRIRKCALPMMEWNYCSDWIIGTTITASGTSPDPFPVIAARLPSASCAALCTWFSSL